ncbi:TIR domain-containing protein [Leptothoe sp. LEGE 181152]|uniref:TIR domain-containing protein n=1 Tax=Adonisia turfae CCMR0081 TaxID=2292702 RepID=A0A6M0RW51_9CYAN|nr:TIR domain-containing protein [Adonisia turfae]MDV3353030.1 TIR domain-containing protein [Leptothoe sp. LEGE 181152]NEZ60043.1 TIR domain-containing protein [Adonisia turfae CCMR0081]
MSSATFALQDAFISYGRADSKIFASKLNNCLVQQGLEVWFDFDDIPLGVDYQNQIDDGIERSQNFLFVIAPHSVNSPYCRLEVEHALRLGKRIIPLLHVESIDRDTWQSRHPNGTEADWQDYQAKGLHSSFPNMHPIISKINWVYFREGIDDFQTSFQGLLDIFERQQDYVHQHTTLLAQSLAWQRHQRQSQYLLIGQNRQQAERWLRQKFNAEQQAPCEPTALHCEFITESIKNANGLMTDVFLSYSEQDRELMDRLRLALMREGFTTWINRTDIRVGGDFQTEINKGIEEASYMVYLMSPKSLESKYCQQELDYARKLNKKIIPLRMREFDLNLMADDLRAIQFINFVNENDIDGSAYGRDIAKLVKQLQENGDYYQRHKQLLVKALKWQRNEQNKSLLLRNHSLRHAEAWLKVARKHGQQGLLPLQEEFIKESLQQPPNQSIDVFISYSRADADFARELNEELQVHGKTTWFDQESIVAGAANYKEEIFNGIEGADHFLFIISPRSIQSPYCADEVDYARSLNKRMLTVLYERVNTKELHPALEAIQWIDFHSKKKDFKTNLSTLLRALETDPAYTRFHTRLLVQALDWDQQDRDESLLLRGKARRETETWLLEAEGKTPQPTRLQQDFVTASASEEIRRQRSAIRLQQIGMGVIGCISLVAIALGIIANQARLEAKRNQQEALAQRARAEEQQTIAEDKTVLAQTETSLALFASHQPFEALLEATLAGIAIKNNERTHSDSALVVTTLQQAVFWVQERNRLEGHDGIIWDTAVSNDGQMIASASADGTARVWGINGNQLAEIKVDDTQVLSVAFSPDGERLAMGLENSQIQIRQLGAQNELLTTLEGHTGPITSVAFATDGRTLASASEDKSVRLWQQDGMPLKELTQHIAAVRVVKFSPDGKLLASGADDRSIRLYTPDGKPLKTLRGHNAEVKGLAFSPDSQTLASASWDETIRLWSATGQPIREIRGHNALVYDVSFSPDGKFLASGSWDKTVRTWTLAGEPVATVFGHSAQIHRVHFNEDGLLVSAGGDRTIRLWELDRPLITSLRDHQANVYSVVFSPDDQVIASAGADNNIRLWNRKGEPIKTLSGHDSVIWELSYSPDGEILASASSDYTAKLWDRNGKLLTTLEGHKGPVYAVTFSPDGQFIATGAADRSVYIWRRDGTLVTKIVDFPKDVLSIAFSDDNKTLATSGWAHFVNLWNLDGKLGENADNGKVYEIIYDPDNKINATDRFEGQVPRRIEGHKGWVHKVAYSPDGKTIATASADGTAKLWSTDGKLLNTLEGHKDGVVSIQFSHDEQNDLIATGSYDHTVKLWSLSKGELVTTLRGHQDRVTNLSMSRDKTLIATVGEDDRLLLWDLDLDISGGKTQLLDKMLNQSCNWLEGYLETHDEAPEEIQKYCRQAS